MKKGFSALLGILITAVIIVIFALAWFKLSEKNLERTNNELKQMNNLVPNNNETQSQPQSVQGQLNDLRNSVNNLADKKDQEILNEMNK